MKSTQEAKEVSKIFGIDEFTPIKLDVDILSYNKANQEAEALLNNLIML